MSIPVSSAILCASSSCAGVNAPAIADTAEIVGIDADVDAADDDDVEVAIGVADDGVAKEEAKEEPPKKKGLFGRGKKQCQIWR